MNNVTYLERQRIWWQQVLALTIKEFRQLFRDRAILLYIIFIFTLDILIAGGGPSMELSNSDIVIHDANHSAQSRALIYRFQPPYFRFAGTLHNNEEGITMLEQEQANLQLSIPPHFGETLRQGQAPATVQLLVDTSKATTGYLASSYSERITAAFSQQWINQHLQQAGVSTEALPRIDNQRRVRFNPTINEAWFYALAEMLTMLTVASVLLPAVATVREKERGTLEQLLVSPLTAFQVMFSKVLAMVIVTFVGTATSLFIIMYPMYGLPLKGNLTLFFTLTALFTFTNAGLGLVAATFARNSGQVGMVLLLIVMPIIVLSGIWTQLETMPTWLTGLMFFSPLRHYIDIAYGILLRGAGLELLWDSVLIMLLLGSSLFAIGLWRFRRQFNG